MGTFGPETVRSGLFDEAFGIKLKNMKQQCFFSKFLVLDFQINCSIKTFNYGARQPSELVRLDGSRHVLVALYLKCEVRAWRECIRHSTSIKLLQFTMKRLK